MQERERSDVARVGTRLGRTFDYVFLVPYGMSRRWSYGLTPTSRRWCGCGCADIDVVPQIATVELWASHETELPWLPALAEGGAEEAAGGGAVAHRVAELQVGPRVRRRAGGDARPVRRGLPVSCTQAVTHTSCVLALLGW